ncbi:hypothetical protein D3C71_1407800 [compost metagenome]
MNREAFVKLVRIPVQNLARPVHFLSRPYGPQQAIPLDLQSVIVLYAIVQQHQQEYR